MGAPSDTPPRVTYLHSHKLLQGPAEGAFRRSHLSGTASGSDLPPHAISSGRLIFNGFPPNLIRKPRYGLLRIITKNLGTIPSIVFIPDNTALSWNRTQQGHLHDPTIFQLRSPAQPSSSAPFGDRCLPILPPPTNGNRYSQPAPWLTPLRLS